MDSTLVRLTLPGLFDLQVNGHAGFWFSSAALDSSQIQTILRGYTAAGITDCLPTLITASDEEFLHGLGTIAREVAQPQTLAARMIRGIHLEGPWISAEDGPRGAHPVQHVRPAVFSDFQRWQDAADGLIRLVTLAPECPGALEIIPLLVDAGVRVAIGHTGASADQIAEAAARGAVLSTHLGNGCSAAIDRHHNVFWPQLSCGGLAASVIADGAHVPADLLKVILLCKGPQRIVLTSDVSGFAGLPVGTHRHGSLQVDLLDDCRVVVSGQHQYLAGSGLLTADCVDHWSQVTGMALEESWALASANPARLLGLELRPILSGDGFPSTCVVVESTNEAEVAARAPSLRVLETWIEGDRVFHRHESLQG